MNSTEVLKVEIVEMTPKSLTEVVNGSLLPLDKKDIPYGSAKYPNSPFSEIREYVRSKEGMEKIVGDFTSFLSSKPELLKAYQDRTISLEQHLLSVTQYMWEATGDHTEDYSMLGETGDISNLLDRKTKPKTRCNIFNKVYPDLFFGIDSKFSLGFGDKVAFISTRANLVRDYGSRINIGYKPMASYRSITHVFPTMVTKDQNGLAYTIIDPYHTEPGIRDIAKLDFTKLRFTNFVYNLVRNRPVFIEALGFCKKVKESLEQFPGLVKAYLLVDIYMNGELENDLFMLNGSIKNLDGPIKRSEELMANDPKATYYKPGLERMRAERDELIQKRDKQQEVYGYITQFAFDSLMKASNEIKEGRSVYGNLTDLSSLLDLLVLKGIEFPQGLMKAVSEPLKRISADRQLLFSSFTTEERDLIWLRVMTDELYVPPNLSEVDLGEWVDIKKSLLVIARSSPRRTPDKKYAEFKTKLESSEDPKAKELLKLMWG